MTFPLEDRMNLQDQMSAGERRIAGVLDSYGIPFEYERPTLVYDRGKSRIWYPDFSLLPYGTLIEYFGVVNDPEYDRGIQKRLDAYRANHMDVIDMYPSSFSTGWDDRLLSRVDRMLESRLYRWRDQIQSKTIISPSPYQSRRLYAVSQPSGCRQPQRYR